MSVLFSSSQDSTPSLYICHKVRISELKRTRPITYSNVFLFDLSNSGVHESDGIFTPYFLLHCKVFSHVSILLSEGCGKRLFLQTALSTECLVTGHHNENA